MHAAASLNKGSNLMGGRRPFIFAILGLGNRPFEGANKIQTCDAPNQDREHFNFSERDYVHDCLAHRYLPQPAIPAMTEPE